MSRWFVLPVLALVASSGGSAAEKPAAGPLSGPYVIALTADGGTVCWQTEKKAAGAARGKAERAGRRALGDVLKGLGGTR